MGGSPSTPKKTQLEARGDAAQGRQTLRDIRREDRRKKAIKTRTAGRLALLGGPEGGRDNLGGAGFPGIPRPATVNPRRFVGGAPQPAAA